MDQEVLEDEYKRKVGVVEATVFDNSITKGVRGRLRDRDIDRMIAEYDEDDKQARIYGKFHHLTGLVFKRFNRKGAKKTGAVTEKSRCNNRYRQSFSP